MNPIVHIQTAFGSYLQKTFGISDELAKSCNFILNVDPNKRIWGYECECRHGARQRA